MSPYCYSVFGHRLSSSIPLPELRSADPGAVRWTFEVVDSLPEPGPLELLGWEALYGSVSARLYRHAGGHRITIGDTGSYDLLDGGARILWQPRRDPWWDFGRGHLIGRVLATSLQLAGTLTLHGSAVEMSGGVVGFLAPKYFGKSTLAMMLHRAGARFVSDDSLPMTVGAQVLASPGVHSLRVRHDEAEADSPWLGSIVGESGRDGKVTLPPLPEDRVLLEPASLSALYFLSPVQPDRAPEPARRVPLPATHAAMGLVSQTKIAAMLGSGFAGEILETAISIASAVPVYQLSIVRDLARLPDVVERLAEWHGLVPVLSTSDRV